MIHREIHRESSQEQADHQDGIEVPATPKINCQEKIILCWDLSSEMNSTSFLRNSQERTVFQWLQKSLNIYVKSKLGINKKHSFALVTLENTAQWFQDFSCDVNMICDTLHQLSPSSTDSFSTFDMSSLCEVLENHVELPVIDNVDLPPQHVVRVIMIYGRSHSSLPSFSGEGRQIFERYMASPYFFFDVLYVHELPEKENNCEAIYDAFCKFDGKEVCFMLEVSRSITRIFDHTAKLLAHPLQRPRQQDIDYKLIMQPEISDEELDLE